MFTRRCHGVAIPLGKPGLVTCEPALLAYAVFLTSTASTERTKGLRFSVGKPNMDKSSPNIHQVTPLSIVSYELSDSSSDEDHFQHQDTSRSPVQRSLMNFPAKNKSDSQPRMCEEETPPLYIVNCGWSDEDSCEDEQDLNSSPVVGSWLNFLESKFGETSPHRGAKVGGNIGEWSTENVLETQQFSNSAGAFKESEPQQDTLSVPHLPSSFSSPGDVDSVRDIHKAGLNAKARLPRTVEPPLGLDDLDPNTEKRESSLSEPFAEDREVVQLEKRQRRSSYSVSRSNLPQHTCKLLANVADFFTKPVNLQRGGQALSMNTFAKANERINCFLGYLHHERHIALGKLDATVFQTPALVEGYLTYLTEIRQLNPSTVANHISSLLYVLKFEHADQGPGFHNVPLIAQLRKTATNLQRQGNQQRPSTTHELKAVGKWLDWEEILECLTLQRQRFEMAKTAPNKARHMMDLVLLAMYCQLPPSRGLEVRSLRIVEETRENTATLQDYWQNKDVNAVVLSLSGSITLHFQNYKNKRYHGHDQTAIQEGSELARLVKEYVSKHRIHMVGAEHKDNNFLFLNSCGTPFSGPAFTKHLKALFHKLSGIEISVNTLRSSFVTYVYSQRDCTDSMKASLAHALRHTQQQAQSTYDKRTAAEKKDEAVSFARECAESFCPPETELKSDPPAQKPMPREFQPGQFVAAVEETSTISVPKVLIARVQHYMATESDEVSLIWYRPTKFNTYCLELDGAQWSESAKCLHAVKMVPAKKRPGEFVLSTSARSIHKTSLGK